MPRWAVFLTVLALAGGAAGLFGVLYAWWLAFLYRREWGWVSSMEFNRYGEAWFEGVVFHLAALAYLWLAWRVLKAIK